MEPRLNGVHIHRPAEFHLVVLIFDNYAISIVLTLQF